jgi:hypothetical protein
MKNKEMKNNSMKKIEIALLMLLAIVLAMPACKKGTDDPFLSLRTRKARLVGEWKLKEGTVKQTDASGTTTRTFNGSTVTITGPLPTQTIAHTETCTIKKDGTFESVINNNGTITTTEGAWYFGGKNKELNLKDEESVVFIFTSVTSGNTISTYSGSSCPMQIMVLDELKNKEMIIKVYGSELDSGTFPNNTTTTITGTKTFVQ